MEGGLNMKGDIEILKNEKVFKKVEYIKNHAHETMEKEYSYYKYINLSERKIYIL